MAEQQKQDEYLIQLLELAQGGDKVAEDNLIAHIRDNVMRRRIGRYIHKNRQVEDEDIRQEFMIGVALAIPKADLTIGNPIEYIISQGIYRVRSYFRKHIMQNTTQVCRDCGYESRLNKVGNTYQCKKCGSTNIDTREVYDYDEVAIGNKAAESDDIEKLTEEIGVDTIIEQFRDTLTKGTRVYDLFVLLYDEDINSDNPDIVNYIAEIARRWGTSQVLVVQTKDKLKSRLITFCRCNGYEIRGNRFIQVK